MQRLAFALVVVFGLGLAAEAEVTSLEGARLGEHWLGPELTLDDLAGRVVFFELRAIVDRHVPPTKIDYFGAESAMFIK